MKVIKILKIFGLAYIAFLMTACNSGAEFKQLRQDFAFPSAEFKTAPNWVWNGIVTEAIIDAQLEDYYQHGIGGVFVQTSYGLNTEYASDDWYELVAYAMKKARSLNMELWPCIENTYPASIKGELPTETMFSARNGVHALRLHRQSKLDPDTAKSYLYIFKGHNDVTDKVDSLRGKRGDFLLWEKVNYPVDEFQTGYSYFDLIKPGMTEELIELTMSGYEEKIGMEFGSAVPGINTTEPHIAPFGEEGLIRWTADLSEQFEKRWGYDPGPHLISLLENKGDYKTVRHNYYQLMLELFIDRWSIPWHKYAEKNKLQWSGNYWEHTWPSPNKVPDNMAMYAWHQVPGIDMMFNNWDAHPDEFGNIRAVRELNSVSNQLGKKRKLGKTYASSGWELTFEDMKRNGDWEYVLGVNMMSQHLSFQNLPGERKHVHPPSFSSHSPWWDEYKTLADYYARLSVALSAGQQHNRILVLEPTTSAWMYYKVGGEKNEIDQIGIDFSSLLKKLEEEQVEYDLGCESIISDYGDIKNGKFEIGDQQYSFVVIPASMDNVNEKTADLLEEFMTFGGIVLSLGPPPVYIDGVETERCSEWPNKFQEEWIAINRINDPRFINFLLSDEFILVEQEGGNLFHQRRIMNDGQLLFLVNSSKTEACKTRFVLQGNDIVKMDPFSGEIENFSCVITSDILSFDATIPPVGSLLLYICDGEIKSRKTRSRKWRGKEKQVEISSIETSALSENVINLDYCYITSNGDTSQLIYSGLDTLNFSSGFEATFPFYLGTNTGDMNMKLAVKNPDLYEVSVNGITAELAEGERWLDKNIGLHDIGKNLHSGENMVTLKAIPGKANFNIEPVYLIGDFEVFALDKAWIIGKSSLIEIGSWKNQGYPFYSDKMKYSASVNNDGRGMAKVILPDWMGTIAYVEVNGSRVGQIFSSPGELRIEKYLKRGENSISVTVVGSLKNLLGPHHYVNQRGTLTPISFRDAPATQPSGMKYDLVNYGLMEPFQVIVSD